MKNLIGFHNESSISNSIEDQMNKLIFHPPIRNPLTYYSLMNDPTFELCKAKTRSGQIVSVLIAHPTKTTTNKCIIISHGNAGDIYSYSRYAKEMANKLNMLFIVYDYLGYGLSDNTPSEQGCYDSIEAVVEFTHMELSYQFSNIILVGQSVGTGVVVDYVAKNKWKYPIALISPYESIMSVVVYSSMGCPGDKLTTYSKLDCITCPIKIIHGENDDVIDIKHGKSIYSNLNNKSFDPLWIKDAGHNDILEKIPDYVWNEIIDFENKN